MFKQLFGQPTRKSITHVLRRKGHERITDVQYNNTELIKKAQTKIKGKSTDRNAVAYDVITC